MNKRTVAIIIQEGGRLISDIMRTRRGPEQSQRVTGQRKARSVELATTPDTVKELKRSLAKELYRMELDLQRGGRIAGRPCDCLSNKHTLGLEAIAEELMSYEPNPVYSEIINWLQRHAPEFEPEGIAKQEAGYYQSLAPETRRFRKAVMGEGMSLEEAQEQT